jgi:hypothetical protein
VSSYTIINKGKQSWLIREASGRFRRIPSPKFCDYQLVQRNRDKDIQLLSGQSWNLPGGWVYVTHYTKVYADHIAQEGGSSCWWEEKDFSEISDPSIKLKAEIFYRERRKQELTCQLKIICDELSKLNFTLNLLGEKDNKDAVNTSANKA